MCETDKGLVLMCVAGLGKMEALSIQSKSGQGPLGSRSVPPKSPAG